MAISKVSSGRTALFCHQRPRPRFKLLKSLLQLLARSLDLGFARVFRDEKRFADHERDGRERLGNLRLVPAVHGPVPAGFEMKRQHGIAGRLRQPHRTGMRDARRAARAVERESRRLARFHVAHHLNQRPAAAARRGAARGAVSEPPDDAGDPLAVEVRAGDDDDAAVSEIDRRGENAAVPEPHDRLVAAEHDLVVMLQAFDAPLQRGAEDRADSVAEDRNRFGLKSLPGRRAPRGGVAHIRSFTNVIRSTNCTFAAGDDVALDWAPLSMIEQNGHAVTTVPAPVAVSCLNRTSLMRLPGSSSLSANSSPPPAPQQYGLSRLRSGSLMSPPNFTRSSRGSSTFPA